MSIGSRAAAISAAALLVTAASASSTSAAPATPDFLKRWKHVDQLYAGWDIAAAERTLNPLLPQATALEGYERSWFNLTAARLLAYVGRDAEAKRFVADQEALTLPRYCGDDPCADSPKYVPWWTKQRETEDRAATIGTPEGIVRKTASDLRREPVTAFSHYTEFLKPFPGGSGALPSYFGLPLYWDGATKPKNQSWRARTHVSNYLQVRFSGGPTGPYSNTSRALVTITSNQRIVAKRSIRTRSKIAVQVYNTKPGAKLIATWTPTTKGSRPLRTRFAVAGHRATIRAPRDAGTYHLQLGVGRNRDFATGVTNVGIGRSAPKLRDPAPGKS